MPYNSKYPILREQSPYWLPSKAANPEGNPIEGIASNGKSKGELALTESEKIAERTKSHSRIERKRKKKPLTQKQQEQKYGYTSGFIR